MHHPLAFPFDVHVDPTFDVLSIVLRAYHLALFFSLRGTSYLWTTKEASVFVHRRCFHRMFPLDSFGFDGTEVWYPHPSILHRSPLRLWRSKGEGRGRGIPRTTTTMVDLDSSNLPTQPTRDHDTQRKGEDVRFEREEASFLDGTWHAFRISAWFGRADPRTTHSSAIHAPVSPPFPVSSHHLVFRSTTHRRSSIGPLHGTVSCPSLPFKPSLSNPDRFGSVPFDDPFRVAWDRRARSKARHASAFVSPVQQSTIERNARKERNNVQKNVLLPHTHVDTGRWTRRHARRRRSRSNEDERTKEKTRKSETKRNRSTRKGKKWQSLWYQLEDNEARKGGRRQEYAS